MIPRLLLGAALAIVVASGGRPAAALPAGFRVEQLYRLEFPAGLAFTPDAGRMFVGERAGRIRVAVGGRLLPTSFASVRTITTFERGLLGIAVDPRWDDGQTWVYAFYTLPDGSANVVDRFRWSSSERSAGRQRIMTLPSARGYHNGGVIAFGPDGKLYVVHGESHDSSRAQNPQITGGKVYRVNPDGSIPADNPFRGSATWAYGIRNSYGLGFSPRGLLYETENGPADHDEVNLIRRGGNYGWPIVRGRAGDRRFVDPIVDYARIRVPTGVAVIREPFPAALHGDLLVGTYTEEALHHIALNADGSRVERDEIWASGEAIVAVVSGPDGVYYTTPDAVKRIVPPAQASPSPTRTPSPTVSPSERTQDGGGVGPLVVLVVLLGGGLAATLALLARRGRG